MQGSATDGLPTKIDLDFSFQYQNVVDASPDEDYNAGQRNLHR